MNAARCLGVLGRPGSDSLAGIARTVQSGDSTGREAYAAREYFKYLNPGFRRRSESSIAAALDYGYAVVRALVARSLASSGLQCALGVGHRSATNPFNLADDFVEVFRPFVDLRVFLNPPERDLTPEYRAHLASTVRLECSIQGSTYTISTAAMEVAASYARAVLARDYKKVLLPELAGTELRSYE
jgi:CRISPR-associated protein Cas1